jgi:hypothetical protein
MALMFMCLLSKSRFSSLPDISKLHICLYAASRTRVSEGLRNAREPQAGYVASCGGLNCCNACCHLARNFAISSAVCEHRNSNIHPDKQIQNITLQYDLSLNGDKPNKCMAAPGYRHKKDLGSCNIKSGIAIALSMHLGQLRKAN